MTLSVERICNESKRNRLLATQDVGELRQRWLRQTAVSVDDPVSFVKGLSHHSLITDYQADVPLRRPNDPLVLGRYKLRGRIGRGPMAGVYEAVHAQGRPSSSRCALVPSGRGASPITQRRPGHQVACSEQVTQGGERCLSTERVFSERFALVAHFLIQAK